MELKRRAVLGTAGLTLVGSAGCISTALDAVSGTSFDTLTVTVSTTAAFSGQIEFDDGNTTNKIPVSGLGEQEFVIPDDMKESDQEAVDNIEPPISASVFPRGGGPDEAVSLDLTVEADSEELGTDTATGDETATVKHDP
ncbi:hypothetical protein [Halostella pelagica]|uniref:hypothetical protein n=1 Tax=Halostella pelagica TaxID=2583824 RepID=UPI00108147F3|nr:hypothetical protein [Halostella pelagica]